MEEADICVLGNNGEWVVVGRQMVHHNDGEFTRYLTVNGRSAYWVGTTWGEGNSRLKYLVEFDDDAGKPEETAKAPEVKEPEAVVEAEPEVVIERKVEEEMCERRGLNVSNTINSYVSYQETAPMGAPSTLSLALAILGIMPILGVLGLVFLVDWDVVGFYLGIASASTVTLLTVYLMRKLIVTALKFAAIAALGGGFAGGLAYAAYLAWPTLVAWAPYVAGGVGVVIAFATCCVIAMYVHEKATMRRANWEVQHQLRLAQVSQLRIEAKEQPVEHVLFSMKNKGVVVEIEQ